MGTRIERRTFLKTTPVAAGALAHAVTGSGATLDASTQRASSSGVKISSAVYAPAADYRIKAVRFSKVKLTDMANHIDFADNGRLHYDDKDFPRRVRAIRAF
jgi:hypothetical protein